MSAEPAKPATLAALGWAGWRAIAENIRVRFARDRCSISAWSLACKGFLAICPALIALLGLVHLLHLGAAAAHKLTASIDKVLPPGASGVVSQAVSSASHQSASESVTALASVGQAIGSHVPFGGTAFTIFWTMVRWLASVAAMIVLLQICYSYGPNRKGPGWRWASPGSIIGAAIFVLASLGFSVYVKNFGSYQKIYGALAGAVVLIFWLYLGGLAVLIGAELNAELEHEAALRIKHACRAQGPGHLS